MKTFIFSFTDKGDKLSNKIGELYKENLIAYKSADVRGKLKELSRIAFTEGELIIFVGAMGIAVRAVAPYIKSKATDPALVVCDELGRFVIPVLSGHIGGGIDFALEISKYINAQPVITTATDINGVWAVDSWAKKRDYYINNVENIREISSRLLKGERVGFYSDIAFGEPLPKEVVYINKPDGLKGNSSDHELNSKKFNDNNFYFDKSDRFNGESPDEVLCKALEAGIVLSPFIKSEFKYTLNLVPKCLSIGIGARKNADYKALKSLLIETFKKYNLNEKAICSVNTIDIKANERAILTLAEELNLRLNIYSSDELMSLKGEFITSGFVKSVTGADNVCERAALMQGGRLLVPKTKGDGVTLAIALRSENNE